MKKIISTVGAPRAIGPYNQAVIDVRSGLLFTAGQIGMDPATGELVGPDVTAQAHQVLKNLKAVLNQAGCRFADVIKSMIYLTNIDDFGDVNAVYAEHFVKDFPARSTVEVSRLPKGALVEIEMVACLPKES